MRPRSGIARQAWQKENKLKFYKRKTARNFQENNILRHLFATRPHGPMSQKKALYCIRVPLCKGFNQRSGLRTASG